MTDQSSPQDPTEGQPPAAAPGTPVTEPPAMNPEAPPQPRPVEAAVGDEPAAPKTELGTASAATAPPIAAGDKRRRWVEVAVLVGAFVLVGGIGFAAGRTIDNGNERGSRSHRIEAGDQNGRRPGTEQLPGRGGLHGQGDGRGGFGRGDGSWHGSGQRRHGGLLPGDRLFPRGGRPGGGWQQPEPLPGATQAPDATQGPTASPAPSATPAP